MTTHPTPAPTLPYKFRLRERVRHLPTGRIYVITSLPHDRLIKTPDKWCCAYGYRFEGGKPEFCRDQESMESGCFVSESMERIRDFVDANTEKTIPTAAAVQAIAFIRSLPEVVVFPNSKFNEDNSVCLTWTKDNLSLHADFDGSGQYAFSAAYLSEVRNQTDVVVSGVWMCDKLSEEFVGILTRSFSD